MDQRIESVDVDVTAAQAVVAAAGAVVAQEAEAAVAEAAEPEPVAEPPAGDAAEASVAAAPTQVMIDTLAVLPGERVLAFRERIIAAQAQFAETPAEALAQAEAVVIEAVAAINQTLLDGVSNIATWRQAGQPDAEQYGCRIAELPSLPGPVALALAVIPYRR